MFASEHRNSKVQKTGANLTLIWLLSCSFLLTYSKPKVQTFQTWKFLLDDIIVKMAKKRRDARIYPDMPVVMLVEGCKAHGGPDIVQVPGGVFGMQRSAESVTF